MTRLNFRRHNPYPYTRAGFNLHAYFDKALNMLLFFLNRQFFKHYGRRQVFPNGMLARDTKQTQPKISNKTVVSTNKKAFFAGLFNFELKGNAQTQRFDNFFEVAFVSEESLEPLRFIPQRVKRS